MNTWQHQWSGDIYFSHGTNHSRGLAILIKPGLDLKVEDSYKDNEGRFFSFDATLAGTPIKLINIYAAMLVLTIKLLWVATLILYKDPALEKRTIN